MGQKDGGMGIARFEGDCSAPSIPLAGTTAYSKMEEQGLSSGNIHIDSRMIILDDQACQ